MNLLRTTFLVALALLLNACHVGRFFVWNFADTRDNKKFKSVLVDNGNEPFSFIEPEVDTSKLMYPRKITVKGEKMSFEEALIKEKTTAFLIIHKDTLVYEKYFYDYEPYTPHTSFSVAKSFVSALVGIAISEGHIKSVDEPITNYIKGFKNPGFDKITIEHLLNMRSGIAFNEGYFNPFGEVAKYYYGRNLKKYIPKLKVEKDPDKSFRYISVNTQLLAYIVEIATKQPVSQYLEEKIWKPLGMEYPATWSVDSKKNATEKAFCCLNARARDFAKFGRLYLNNGNWEGKQIVPEEWVKRSATFTEPTNNFYYKYQWWHTSDAENLTDSTDLDEVHRIYAYKNKEGETIERVSKPGVDYYAEGILGQFIYIHPEKDLIIVRLGKKYGKVIGDSWPYSIFRPVAELY